MIITYRLFFYSNSFKCNQFFTTFQILEEDEEENVFLGIKDIRYPLFQVILYY